MSETRPLTLSGAPEGFDALLVARELAKTARPVVHVARDARRLAAMAAALDFFAPDVPRLTLPGWDCLPFDRVSPNPDVSAARMATLAALTHGMPTERFILLTTVSAATQRMPAREVIAGASFSARVGDRIDEAALRAFLVRMGFVQAPTVTEPGDFAVRGGIIDIYPPGEAGPVRLDLFGDTLRMGQLVGQGHADLAGDLAVLAGLGFLDTVPQLGSVGDPIRRVVRGEDLGVIDTAALGVIEDKASAAIFDTLRHTIGNCRRGAAALTAGNHRGSKMVDRHVSAALS